MTHIPNDPLILLSRRRLLGRLALGGSAALALAACGGGGGGDSETDSRDLRAAFDRLKPGMTWEEAIAAVGWQPNDGNNAWANGGYLLLAGLGTKSLGDRTLYLETALLSGNGFRETRYYSSEAK